MKLACCNDHVRKGEHYPSCESIRDDDGKVVPYDVIWAEIERLRKLSTCLCGDGFTEHDPGTCGICVALVNSK